MKTCMPYHFEQALTKRHYAIEDILVPDQGRWRAMKIICLEEPIATPEIIADRQTLDPATRDLAIDKSTWNDKERRRLDTGDMRITAMDEAEIDIAVLSHITPKC